jgi:hypothetical protein
MWASLTISASLLLLDPSAAQLDLLGFSVDRARLLFVAPMALVSVLLARQVVIHNAAEIVGQAKDKKDLSDIAATYPLSEFMRWRFHSSLETVVLSIFQAVSDYVPAVAFLVFALSSSVPWPAAAAGTALLWLLALWNYNVLRRKVFEPLLGPIRTPD